MRAKTVAQSTIKYIFIALVIALSIALACTLFADAYSDFADMCVTVFNRVKHYIYVLFDINQTSGGEVIPPDGVAPPIPDIDIQLPATPEYLGARFAIWGNMLISGRTYAVAGGKLLEVSTQVLQLLLIIVLPLIILLVVLIKAIYYHQNTKHGRLTPPLRLHNMISSVIYTSLKRGISGAVSTVKNTKAISTILLIIWAFNFNLVTIVLNAVSFYLYFVVTFKFGELYNFVVDIILSLKFLASFGAVPLIIGGVFLVDKLRKKTAVARLERLEAYNEKILSKRDISTYKWGNMGCRKTMSMTDQILTLSVMDCKQASKDMNICRKIFPHFDWILFELELEHARKNGKIKNLATACDYVNALQSDFEAGRNDLYGYDTYRYKMEHRNGTTIVTIFDVLRDYARLHDIYTNVDSFIISNYPIREDRVPMTVGNSIRWDYSFFTFAREPEDSYYSKILNFDILRSRKTMKDALINDSLEYGILGITEDDKEQTNAVETLGDSKESPYPSPKNDGVTMTEKMIRHRATIMGHCYIHLLKDGQRTQSINADTREISTLERIKRDKRGERWVLPFYWVDKLICGISHVFDKFIDDMRYYRGDTTLLLHFVKIIDKKLFDHYEIIKNRYTYNTVIIESEHGTYDGDVEKVKYNLMTAKIYANRYNTAMFEEFFYGKSRASNMGVRDYRAYSDINLHDDERAEQGSYMDLELKNPDWRKPYIEKVEQKNIEQKAKDQALIAYARESAKYQAKAEYKRGDYDNE